MWVALALHLFHYLTKSFPAKAIAKANVPINTTNLKIFQPNNFLGHEILIQKICGQNEAGMLRVIITSFDNRREAEASREQVKGRFAPDFQDAWILEKIR